MSQKSRREIRKNAPSAKPPKKREALLGVVVGRKGVGKTHKTLQEIYRYSLYRENPRRALLFDVNNEFTQFPPIALKDIRRWCASGKVEIRRISIFKAKADAELTVNGQKIYGSPTGKMTLSDMAGALYYILENFFMGLLLVEDINKYISDSLPNDLIGAICTQRHVGVDVIIHFQNIGRFGHPKIIGNANWLRFHKVTDSVKRHSNKFEDILEPLSICEIMVNTRYKSADKDDKEACSFHVYWDANEEKIKGAYTEKEFYEALEKYLRVNSKTLVEPLLNERDLWSGEKIHADRATLIKSIIQEKKEAYYGNK